MNNPYNIIKGEVLYYLESDEGPITTEIETTPTFLECSRQLNETKLRRTLLEAEEFPVNREFEAATHEKVGLLEESDSLPKLQVELNRLRSLLQKTHAETSNTHM